jgi:hypothetical protein
MLTRHQRVAKVCVALDGGRYVEIRGDAGVGKSGVLKHFAEQISGEAQVIVLSPSRTVPRGWLALRSVIGFDGTTRDLLSDIAGDGSAVLFVDNLDFYDDEERLTVIDLLREAAKVPGMSVIVTARHDFGVAEPCWLPADVINQLERAEPVVIDELSDAETEELRNAAPNSRLADNHPARQVARNLFRLSRLAGLSFDALFSDPALVQKLPLDRPTPAGLARGVELAARMTIEHAPASIGWKSFLDAVYKNGHHDSWRRAARLALVRSEIGNELLKRASAHLFDNQAEVLRELVRLVMAVDVEPGTKRFSGLGVDPRLIPVGLNVPNGPSWSRAENRRELAGLWWDAKGDWTRAHESALRCPWRKMVDVSGFLPC